MGQISMVFFEKFKDLEKICNEIYGKTGGVTEYINEMEKTKFLMRSAYMKRICRHFDRFHTSLVWKGMVI